jgi:hypothetical protein
LNFLEKGNVQKGDQRKIPRGYLVILSSEHGDLWKLNKIQDKRPLRDISKVGPIITTLSMSFTDEHKAE